MTDKQPISPFKKKLAGAAAAGALAVLTLLTTHFEGTKTKPYYDIGGVATVCLGHTGDVDMNRMYTLEECKALQERDEDWALAAVDRHVTVKLPVKVRAALGDFVFNLGEHAFATSTLLRKINAGDGAKACPEILRWDHQGHKQIKGLTRRREIEYWLCVEGFEGR